MPDNPFEQDYFLTQYGGNYHRRNPPYKWRAFLKVIRGFRQSGTLLDIGCALGLFLQQARQFYRCSGCDVSHYAIEQARALLAPDVTFFQGELGKLPASEQYASSPASMSSNTFPTWNRPGKTWTTSCGRAACWSWPYRSTTGR